MFENGSGDVLTREARRRFRCMRNQARPPASKQTITVNVGLGCPST